MCALSDTTLTFGMVTVGQFADRAFTVENTGGGMLTGTVTEQCSDFSILGDASYSLTAGQMDTITVRFAPTTAVAESCMIETGSASCADVSAIGAGVFTIRIVAINGNMSFSPNPAVVTVGQIVAWRNAHSTSHTATANGGAFNTGTISAGATSQPITMGAAGAFGYHCSIHPSMVGTLQVNP